MSLYDWGRVGCSGEISIRLGPSGVLGLNLYTTRAEWGARAKSLYDWDRVGARAKSLFPALASSRPARASGDLLPIEVREVPAFFVRLPGISFMRGVSPRL